MIRRLAPVLREPLVQFLLLGTVLFGIDRGLNGAPTPADAGRDITVTASRQAELREVFRAEYGRPPTEAEFQSHLDRWLEEQVLYREALALGLDQKDVIVQRQMTQKMRLLIDDAQQPPEPTEAELLERLQRLPERYGYPATVSFEQVFLSRGHHGPALEAAAAAVGRQLAQSPESFRSLGEPMLTGPVITSANATQLRRDFGPDYGPALDGLPVGTWSGPIASGLGLHWVRVTARSAFTPATLDSVRDKVRADEREARHEQQRLQTLAQLKAQYRIHREAATP